MAWQGRPPTSGLSRNCYNSLAAIPHSLNLSGGCLLFWTDSTGQHLAMRGTIASRPQVAQMFEQVADRPRRQSRLRSYCFHLFVGLTLSLSIGLIVELITSKLYADYRVSSTLAPGMTLVAGIVGFGLNSSRRDRTALFVFLPPLIFFCDSWYGLTTSWSPSWSSVSRYDYVMNNLFGPMCNESECLYVMGTAVLLPGIFYSLGSLIGLRISSRRR